MSNGKTAMDLTGMKYGAWLVIEPGPKTKSGSMTWKCKCDCGTIKYVPAYALRSGGSKGCHACLWNRQLHPRAHTDGSRRWINNKPTKTYRRWLAMRARCGNPNNKAYKNYGGRGITVCNEWNKSFQAYYDYVSKLEGYGDDGKTLDRIDNNKGYEPGNVRWATRSEQEKNKRSKRLISLKCNQFSVEIKKALKENGITRHDFAREMGVNYNTVGKWVNGKGMPSKERTEQIIKRFNITL